MQGMASISDNDVKEYFDNFEKHKKLFYWEDVSDEKAIKMAFGKEEKDIERKGKKNREMLYMILR